MNSNSVEKIKLLQENANENKDDMDSSECEDDRISKVFVGKKILITGGSGFVGKVLIEKLLRSCPGISKIYLLTRPKKGKQPQERLKDIFDNVLFDLVKKQQGEKSILSKVCVINGDVSAPNLDLSEKDRELLINEINLIYHSAATVRFDSPLSDSVFLNVRGTKLMLELAKQCKHLEYFSYISTAYCHGHIKTLLEKPYPPPVDPHKLISACEVLGPEVINLMTKKILGNIPNTYVFSKALAEGIVSETFDELPTSILRPSIIIPIWKEPIPGWTDNINGPTGLLIGAGKGVIRTMYCNSKKRGDFIPVDIVANGIILATWQYLSAPKFGEALKVMHISAYKEIRLSWQDIIDIGNNVIENRTPLDWVMWYPGGSLKSNLYIHYICMILFQWIPALFLDLLLILLRYPPVLCKVQKRVYHGYEVFEYFANNEWDFDNSQALKLRKLMNSTEKKKFVIEKIDLDIYQYFENSILAARRYILKEKDENIPTAKRHMKIMWWVDKICKTLITVYFLNILINKIFIN